MKEIELKCLLTFSNGSKERVVVCLRGGKPIFFEQKEKELLADFNRMLANTPNRVVKCHIMRN